MTTTTDRNSKVTQITPRVYWTLPVDFTHVKQVAMTAEIYRFVREDTTDQSLLCEVVEGCYKRSATVEYLAENADKDGIGYKLCLSTVNTVIGNALKVYISNRGYIA